MVCTSAQVNRGSRLAARAVERRAVHELLPADHRPAAPARQALAAVRVQRAVEVARLAVDIDVQRVERRAALRQRVAHHLGGTVEHKRAVADAVSDRRDPGAVDLRAPQRLVGVDVADARHHGLIQQLAFDLGVLAAQHRHDGVGVEARVQRVAGQVRDGHRNHAAVDLDDLGEHPAAERALVDETQRGAVVEQRGDPHVIGLGVALASPAAASARSCRGGPPARFRQKG